MMLQGKRKGFTLMELLVVVAIIGLIGALVMAALNRRRIRDRDVVRLADFAQFQKSLDLAFANGNQYPTALTPIAVGEAAYDALCSKGAVTAFVPDTTTANCDPGKVYVSIVPGDPNPNLTYQYKSYAGGGSYCMQMTLELGGINNLTAGPVRMDQNSLTNGTCP
jgi:prepilin-type N-terminal cleavage/methylation domain-containing protein